MYEVNCGRPHEYRERGYTPVEYRSYCEGYYHAITIALQVMDLTIKQFNDRVRRRRMAERDAVAKKGAA